MFERSLEKANSKFDSEKSVEVSPVSLNATAQQSLLASYSKHPLCLSADQLIDRDFGGLHSQ
jgi:hypothetical protein